MASRTQRAQVNFGTGTQPPPPLADAILSSSRRYRLGDVGPQLLAGIWREEAGSAYPNPYVNSSGYGGLFGTRLWNASTQAQADEAASVLATGLKQSGGIISEALSYYNSGKLHGGYTSVPGLTIDPSTGVPVTQIGGNVMAAPPRPGVGGSGGSSFWGSVEAAAGFFLPGGGLDKNVAQPLFGPDSATAKIAEDLIKSPLDFLKAAVWMLNPITWLRAVEAAFGFALILAGVLVVLGADRALQKLPGPTGAAASLAAE